MSAANALLIFLGREAGFDGWLRLADGAVAERGAALEALPPLTNPETAAPVSIAAIVPGDQLALHWLELPAGLAPAQAAAAARLMAGELSAQPLGEMHVAVGPELEGSPLRCVALVAKERMTEWIARCQAAAVDPDMMVTEPLLLLPAEGKILRHDRGDLPLYRGPSDAFSAEPEVAAAIVGETALETVDDETFEAGLAKALELRPVDLRQGIFAKRRRWAIDWKLMRRLAMLAIAILLATLAIQVASILRYTFATDALEAEAKSVAAAALPEGRRITDASGELSRRLAELRGGGVSLGEGASVLFAAVRDTPNVELGALVFDQGAARATVRGDSPATLNALRQRIQARGFTAELGPLRSGDGRQVAELTVRGP